MLEPKSLRQEGQYEAAVPTVKDRVVQPALRMVLEPIFEREFHPHSYGFRPKRGCKDALRHVQRLLDAGATWVVDADIQSYFDTIPHQSLMTEMETRVADGRVLKLLEAYLTQGVMDGLEQWTPEAGTPQGAVMTPPTQTITRCRISCRDGNGMADHDPLGAD